MNIKCDSCSTEFDPALKNQVQDNVKIIFIECPKCSTRFLSYVEDEEIRKGLQEAKKLRRKLWDITTSKDRMEIQAQLKNLTVKNRVLMNQKIKEYKDVIESVINHN